MKNKLHLTLPSKFCFWSDEHRNMKSKLYTSYTDFSCMTLHQGHTHWHLSLIFLNNITNVIQKILTLILIPFRIFNNTQIYGINLTCRKKFTSCFHIYTPIFLSYVSSNRFLAQAITYSASSIMIVMWKEFSFGRWNFIKSKSL